jgi:hypothetical protein
MEHMDKNMQKAHTNRLPVLLYGGLLGGVFFALTVLFFGSGGNLANITPMNMDVLTMWIMALYPFGVSFGFYVAGRGLGFGGSFFRGLLGSYAGAALVVLVAGPVGLTGSPIFLMAIFALATLFLGVAGFNRVSRPEEAIFRQIDMDSNNPPISSTDKPSEVSSKEDSKKGEEKSGVAKNDVIELEERTTSRKNFQAGETRQATK